MSRSKSLWITLVVYLLSMLLGYLTYTYVSSNLSLFLAVLFANIVSTIIVFIASILINNSSLYDPYWSVVPILIIILWIIELQANDVGSLLILLAVIVWGLRLTTNWMTDFKGYSHEDFRYVDFREKFGKGYWIISFLGIHMFPTLIVYVAMYPLYYTLRAIKTYYIFLYLGVALMIIGAIISFIADNQLREHKSKGNKNSIVTELWKYTRHPNYFGEVSFWFGASVVSLISGFNVVCFIGFICMWLLFNLYSVPKMEDKLLNNKPDYQQVIDTVPRFFINPFIKE